MNENKVNQPLIEVRKLKKFFPLKKKHIFQRQTLNVKANEDISLTIYKGETLGLVGESGCGKSTLGRVILQLYPPTSGSALYYGMPLRETNPKYVISDIKAIPKLQRRAQKYYNKSLVYDAKVEELEKYLKSEEHKLIKNNLKAQLDEIINENSTLTEQKKVYIEETIQALKLDAESFKEANPDITTIGKGINWIDEVNKINEMLKNDDETRSIEDYISLLGIPHGNTTNAYKKVLKIHKRISLLKSKIEKLSKSKTELKIANYKYKSKEAKKEASRTLRIGSETVGEYILEDNIKKITELFLQEELTHRKRFAKEQENKKLKLNIDLIQKRLARLNDELKEITDDEKQKELASKINKLNSKIIEDEEKIKENSLLIQEYQSKQDDLLKELKTYHFKNPLPITERCLDPEYQKKMESNREFAINLQKVGKEEMRKLRQKLQIIFQDPYSSLDPRMTVGQAISEAVVEHGLFKKNSPELEEYVIDTMAKCGLDHYMIHRYPHQFSGGQRQRIVIARALALQPEFVVCDESVSALDVSIQSQILNLLEELKEKHDLTYLFISHDLSVIKHISNRIGVMYLGNLVELCDAETLYDNPLHPYSKALISAIPTTSQSKRDRIILEGDIPSNIFPPSGCKFRTRCPLAREKCAKVAPTFEEVEPNHFVACHFYEETKNLK